MSRRSADDWLDDIVLWGERLKSHLQNADWTSFLTNSMLQDAVSKCIEAIGEASGKLDAAIVWQTATEAVPRLVEAARAAKDVLRERP